MKEREREIIIWFLTYQDTNTATNKYMCYLKRQTVRETDRFLWLYTIFYAAFFLVHFSVKFFALDVLFSLYLLLWYEHRVALYISIIYESMSLKMFGCVVGENIKCHNWRCYISTSLALLILNIVILYIKLAMLFHFK